MRRGGWETEGGVSEKGEGGTEGGVSEKGEGGRQREELVRKVRVRDRGRS